jgi:hypothetical protein
MNELEQVPIHTFVIRLWQEWSLETPQWRGRVLHLPSGETAAFQDWEQLVLFMQGLNAKMEPIKEPSKSAHCHLCGL